MFGTRFDFFYHDGNKQVYTASLSGGYVNTVAATGNGNYIADNVVAGGGYNSAALTGDGSTLQYSECRRVFVGVFFDGRAVHQMPLVADVATQSAFRPATATLSLPTSWLVARATLLA